MIKRRTEELIKSDLFKGKTIILFGARQVGKTTLPENYEEFILEKLVLE